MLPAISSVVIFFVAHFQMAYAPTPGETLIRALQENGNGTPQNLDDTTQGQLTNFVTAYFDYQVAASVETKLPWTGVTLTVPNAYFVYFGSVNFKGGIRKLTMHEDEEAIPDFFINSGQYWISSTSERRSAIGQFAGEDFVTQLKHQFLTTQFSDAGIAGRQYTRLVNGEKEAYYFVAIALKEESQQ